MEQIDKVLTFLQDRILFHQDTIKRIHTNEEDKTLSRGQIMEDQYLMQLILHLLEEEVKDDRTY